MSIGSVGLFEPGDPIVEIVTKNRGRLKPDAAGVWRDAHGDAFDVQLLVLVVPKVELEQTVGIEPTTT